MGIPKCANLVTKIKIKKDYHEHYFISPLSCARLFIFPVVLFITSASGVLSRPAGNWFRDGSC